MMENNEYVIGERMLDVGDGHELYVQEWGNPNASTLIIFLHGGPGGQIKDKHRSVFDPETHRVLFFDQRGCGKSTPYASLRNNSTEKLITDITKIADTFGANKFILHGSSWGSTLALAYALENPDRVQSLVVGGVYTASKTETAWLDNGEFRTFFPDAWQAYLDRTPKAHHGNPSKYHYNKVVNGNTKEQKLSAYAYGCLEYGVIQLDDRFTVGNFEEFDPAGTRIEMYYLSNGCFLPERHIINNANKLTMPVHIVQGRYDMVCPPVTAYELHTKLPNSKLYWTLSGHKAEHEGENIFKTIFASIK